MSVKPRRPKSWSVGDVETHLGWARDMLDELAGDVGVVFFRASCDMDNGLRGAGDGRSTRYGDDGANNGPSPRVALGRVERPDPVARATQAYLECVVSLCAVVGDLVKHRGTIVGLSPEAARELVEERKPGRGAECANPACARWVENTPSDPLRSGRCDACRKYRARHEGVERPAERVEETVYKEAG